jgi:carboxymethylenebutenolidase
MCHDRITWPISGGAPTATNLEHLDREDTHLPIYIARPEGEGKRAAVVLVHDINGPIDFYRDMAGRLAEEGYLTALPDLFVRQGNPADGSPEAKRARMKVLDKDLALEDIIATLRFLRDQQGAEGPVGLIGFCMGGTLAMLSAGMVGGPDAAVSFYGFPAAREGWPLAPMDEADSVRVPLLLIVGDQDAAVGMDNMEKYEAALDAAGKDYESITYAEVGHGFMTFDENADSFPQASDAWTATLQFLDQHPGINA